MNSPRCRKIVIQPSSEADAPLSGELAEQTVLVDPSPVVAEASMAIPVFDVDAVRRQIEQLIGRDYHGHLEEYLGSPFPRLSEADQSRLDRLIALHDDPKRGHRELLFGSQIIVDALAGARSQCPGFEPIIDLVSRGAMLSQRTGSPLFVPPILLAGPPGVGKTHASRRIAQALQIDVHVINCATNSDFQALSVLLARE